MIEEYVFNEGDDGKEIYFITQGKVAVLHKDTETYVIDLLKDMSFGEIAFFTEYQRQCTIKSRDYTDTLTINVDDFLDIADKYSEDSLILYHRIRGSFDQGKKDFSSLQIKCYLCDSRIHISIDCPQFRTKMKGNVHAIKRKLRK